MVLNGKSIKRVIKINKLTIYVNPKASIRTINRISLALEMIAKEYPKLFDKPVNVFIIRNPFNKLVSGYLNKYVEAKEHYLEQFKENNKGVSIDTFETFVHEIKKNGVTTIDTFHFQLQTAIINNVAIDYYFNSEDLEHFIQFINKEILRITKNKKRYIKNIYPRQLYHKQKATYKDSKKIYRLNREELLTLIQTNQVPSYKSFYSPELKRIIARYYYADVALFMTMFDKKRIL